jgi:hypothetical protein
MPMNNNSSIEIKILVGGIYMNISIPRSDWTIENLMAMKQPELMELFLTLSAPSMHEMQGEYRGTLLDTGTFWLIKNFLAYFALSSDIMNGKWLGKGFTAQSTDEGHGYNSYRKSGKVRHILPMKTYLSTSRYDKKKVFILDYTTYRSSARFINMVDELRKINDNLYLGIGTWGYSRWQRMIPFFFALSGPPIKYIGTDKPHREVPSKYSKLL